MISSTLLKETVVSVFRVIGLMSVIYQILSCAAFSNEKKAGIWRVNRLLSQKMIIDTIVFTENRRKRLIFDSKSYNFPQRILIQS